MLNKFFHRVFSLKMQSDESLISQDTTHRAEHPSQEFERYRFAAPGKCHTFYNTMAIINGQYPGAGDTDIPCAACLYRVS